MNKVMVLSADGHVLGRFNNVLAAAIWSNARGYAHPMLQHKRYHVNGDVSFASELVRPE